jgi:ABC-type phosphate transport system permease subunit
MRLILSKQANLVFVFWILSHVIDRVQTKKEVMASSSLIYVAEESSPKEGRCSTWKKSLILYLFMLLANVCMRLRLMIGPLYLNRGWKLRNEFGR